MSTTTTDDIIQREVTAYGRKVHFGCDGNCGKAWGINARPKVQFAEDDEDDVAWLADGEIGEAPIDPGTYEGRDAKPTSADARLNKWCLRECERAESSEGGPLVHVRRFDRRRYNRTERQAVADECHRAGVADANGPGMIPPTPMTHPLRRLATMRTDPDGTHSPEAWHALEGDLADYAQDEELSPNGRGELERGAVEARERGIEAARKSD